MRDRQIDILKGFGIFFVVLGHTSSIFSGWIYSFHMPLFFFISGFLRYHGTAKPWGVFLKNKAKATLLPYVVFWAISVFIHPILHYRTFGPVGLDQVKALLLGAQWMAEYTDNMPLWYLQFFFIATVAFEAVIRYCPARGLPVLGALLALVTIPFQNLLPGRPVFHINILPAALVFMLLGYGTNHLMTQRETLRKLKSNVFLGLALLALGFFLSRPFDTNVSEIRRLTYFPGALCTILGFYILSSLLTRSKLLPYLGNSSLHILGLHAILWTEAYILTDLLRKFLPLENSSLRNVVRTCFCITCCCILKELYLFGKKKILAIKNE